MLGSPYTVTFQGTLAATDVPQMIGSATGLTGGISPAVNVATTTPGSAAGSLPATASIGTVAATDYIYVTGDVPGTYTYRFFQDTNGNSQLDAADERSSDLITMTVVDAGGPLFVTARL